MLLNRYRMWLFTLISGTCSQANLILLAAEDLFDS